MATNSEHGQHAKKLATFALSPATSSNSEMQVTALFYACLHMFEATAYELNPKHGLSDHYTTHTDRRAFLNNVSYTSPFAPVVRDYKILQSYSERSRYLSLRATSKYFPLTSADIADAKTLYQDIKRELEDILKNEGKKVPW